MWSKLRTAADAVWQEYIANGKNTKPTMAKLAQALVTSEPQERPVGYVNSDDLADYQRVSDTSSMGMGLTVYPDRTNDIDIPVYLTVPDDEGQPYLVGCESSMETCIVSRVGVNHYYGLMAVGDPPLELPRKITHLRDVIEKTPPE